MQETSGPAGEIPGIGRDHRVFGQMFVNRLDDMAKDQPVIRGDRRPVHDRLMGVVQAFDPSLTASGKVAGARRHHRLDELMRIATQPKFRLEDTAHFLGVGPDMDHRLIGHWRAREAVALAHRRPNPFANHEQ